MKNKLMYAMGLGLFFSCNEMKVEEKQELVNSTPLSIRNLGKIAKDQGFVSPLQGIKEKSGYISGLILVADTSIKVLEGYKNGLTSQESFLSDNNLSPDKKTQLEAVFSTQEALIEEQLISDSLALGLIFNFSKIGRESEKEAQNISSENQSNAKIDKLAAAEEKDKKKLAGVIISKLKESLNQFVFEIEKESQKITNTGVNSPFNVKIDIQLSEEDLNAALDQNNLKNFLGQLINNSIRKIVEEIFSKLEDYIRTIKDKRNKSEIVGFKTIMLGALDQFLAFIQGNAMQKIKANYLEATTTKLLNQVLDKVSANLNPDEGLSFLKEGRLKGMFR